MCKGTEKAKGRREGLLAHDELSDFYLDLLAMFVGENEIRAFVDAVILRYRETSSAAGVQFDTNVVIGLSQSAQDALRDAVEAYAAKIAQIASEEYADEENASALCSGFLYASGIKLSEALIGYLEKSLSGRTTQLIDSCGDQLDAFEDQVAAALDSLGVDDTRRLRKLALSCCEPVRSYVIDRLRCLAGLKTDAERFEFPAEIDQPLRGKVISAADTLVADVWKLVQPTLGSAEENHQLTERFIEELARTARGGMTKSVDSPGPDEFDTLFGDLAKKAGGRIGELARRLGLE